MRVLLLATTTGYQTRAFGEAAVIEPRPSMAGEDFPFFLEKAPGGWKIARVDSTERVKTLVPYGTPVQ